MIGRKTPGSLKKSARKTTNLPSKLGTATRETSKRALFLSPPQDKLEKDSNAFDVSCHRIEKSKRALFSPPRRLERSISNISNISENSSLCSSSHKKFIQHESSSAFSRSNSDVAMCLKRRRETYDEENMEPRSSKLPRYQTQVIATQCSSTSTSIGYLNGGTYTKAVSENSICQSQQLSASHKQKLLWAVSTALKKKNIATAHENFNHFASVLAKVVKRLYLETLSSKMESTSATMLR